MDYENHTEGKPRFFATRANLVLLGFLAIGGYFLVTEHWAHVIPFLPWLLFLACPLMHVFMHHGSGGHENDAHREVASDGRSNEPRQD